MGRVGGNFLKTAFLKINTFMKRERILQLAVLCSVMTGQSANAALINLVKPTPADPYYADFTANSLLLAYTYHGNNSGTLQVTTTGSSGVAEAYESGSSSAGTGFNNGGTGYNNQAFTGIFTLTANIQEIGSVWSVTGGSFTMDGTLLGGSSSSLLLSGSLMAGGDGPGGTWGYLAGSKLFEFLYSVNTGNAADGALPIREDFATGNPLGSTIAGGIKLNLINAFSQGFTSSWANTGFADAFVPEPEAYAWAAAGLAGLGLICGRRKPIRQA